MSNEDEVDRTDSAFIWGLIWSAVAIAVPAALFSVGIYPTVMTGAILGAVIRFGTDMTIIIGGEPHIKHPVTVLMLLIQMGTLLAGIIAALTGSMLGLGVAGIILLTYVVGLLIQLYHTDSESDGEWKYDPDEL